mmetsp:Transcript_7330/g.16668  ORF Transcript_7330/g.16668 Transcript_7330/m.16668 type:complete len:300 (-) Transcript_7330:1017-1916(-)
MQITTLRHDALRLPHRLRGDRGVHNLVQRDDGDAPPQLAPLKECLARLLVVRDHKEETATCADFQSAVEGGVIRVDVEKLGHNTLHGIPVEASVGVLVVEIDATEVCPEEVDPLLDLVQGPLALLCRPQQLLVALRVEVKLLQLLPLLGDEVLRVGLLLEEPLPVLLALRQALLRGTRPLLEVGDGQCLFLLIRLHLRESGLRVQELLPQRLALAFSLRGCLRRHARRQSLHRPLRLLDVLLDLLLLLSKGVVLCLLLLVCLFLVFHLLLQVTEGRLGLLAALEESLEVRFTILELRLS